MIEYYKRITYMAMIIIILLFINNESFANSIDSSQDNNYKYHKEYLTGVKNDFIMNYGDLPVKEIRVKGAVKTRISYIMSHTDSKAGDLLSTFNPHSFVNKLKRKNIFSDIEIYYFKESGMAIIEIVVTEKITVIPLPMFSSNSRNTVYGFYLLESNFLGYGKNLFTGGTWSNAGWSGIFGYIDPALFSSFRMNVFLIYKNNIYQDGDIDGYMVREYKSEERRGRLDIGWNFKSIFFFYLSGSYQSFLIDEGYRKGFNPPEPQEDIRGAILFTISDLAFYEYFNYGLQIRTEIAEHIPIDSRYKSYRTGEIHTDYFLKVFSFHRISFSGTAFFGNAPDVALERIGGKPGFRTLPADIITAEHYLSATAAYEFPFLKYKWGAVTILSFWEHGLIIQSKESYSFYGPGAGILIYLKRVALPAVGFNYARNLKTDNSEFSVSVGFSF